MRLTAAIDGQRRGAPVDVKLSTDDEGALAFTVPGQHRSPTVEFSVKPDHLIEGMRALHLLPDEIQDHNVGVPPRHQRPAVDAPQA